MLILHDWQNFYILMGTAAATLMGLLFVAVSSGGYLPPQQAKNYLRTFVNPTLLYYFQVLLVACLGIMPLANALIFIGALVVVGSINVALILKILRRIVVVHGDDEIDGGHWIWHVLLPALVSLLFLGTAIGFFLGITLAPMGLAVAELLLIGIGLHNTWTLTIWLTLHRGQPGVS